MGNIITCAMNCNYRISAILYTPETGLFLVDNYKYPAKKVIIIIVIIIR
jgi:hypothetical protein